MAGSNFSTQRPMLQNIYQDRDVVPGKLHALGKGKGKYARRKKKKGKSNVLGDISNNYENTPPNSKDSRGTFRMLKRRTKTLADSLVSSATATPREPVHAEKAVAEPQPEQKSHKIKVKNTVEPVHKSTASTQTQQFLEEQDKIWEEFEMAVAEAERELSSQQFFKTARAGSSVSTQVNTKGDGASGSNGTSFSMTLSKDLRVGREKTRGLGESKKKIDYVDVYDARIKKAYYENVKERMLSEFPLWVNVFENRKDKIIHEPLSGQNLPVFDRFGVKINYIEVYDSLCKKAYFEQVRERMLKTFPSWKNVFEPTTEKACNVKGEAESGSRSDPCKYSAPNPLRSEGAIHIPSPKVQGGKIARKKAMLPEQQAHSNEPMARPAHINTMSKTAHNAVQKARSTAPSSGIQLRCHRMFSVRVTLLIAFSFLISPAAFVNQLSETERHVGVASQPNPTYDGLKTTKTAYMGMPPVLFADIKHGDTIAQNPRGLSIVAYLNGVMDPYTRLCLQVYQYQKAQMLNTKCLTVPVQLDVKKQMTMGYQLGVLPVGTYKLQLILVHPRGKLGNTAIDVNMISSPRK